MIRLLLLSVSITAGLAVKNASLSWETAQPFCNAVQETVVSDTRSGPIPHTAQIDL